MWSQMSPHHPFLARTVEKMETPCPWAARAARHVRPLIFLCQASIRPNQKSSELLVLRLPIPPPCSRFQVGRPIGFVTSVDHSPGAGEPWFAIGLAPASIEAGIGPAISAADPAARSHRRLAGRARRRASASPTTGRARQALSRVRRSRRLCLFRSNKPSPLLSGGQWTHRVRGVITCGAGSRRRRGSRRSGNSRRG